MVVGHVYPVWYEFRGGKGAATLIGAVAVLAPQALIPVAVVWLACVMLTGYVGLGTMLGSASLPVYFALARPGDTALLAFGLVMAAFVVYTHRANIARMRAGNENRARRLWLLRPDDGRFTGGAARESRRRPAAHGTGTRDAGSG